MPKVSVVMSVYNGAEYLSEAIDSILAQTFPDFELIIIDDASSDDSQAIINGYTDKRIRLLINESNLGLPASLNKGIRYAQGKYIVRMDSDDISLPDRIEKQVRFMDAHPDIAASSGNYYMIDSFGNISKNIFGRIRSHKMNEKMLQRYALIPSPLVHPAAIIRKEVFDKGVAYNEKYKAAQDYDLWLNIWEKYKLGNIKDIILKYRVHSKSISKKKKERQLSNAYEIFLKHIENPLSFEEFKTVMRFELKKNPIKYARLFYQVFHVIDYYFIYSLILYTIQWGGMKIKNN